MLASHLLSMVLLAASAAPADRSAPLRVREVSRSVHPLQRGAGAERHVDLPYFEAGGRLRWDGDVVAAAGACTPASFPDAVPADAWCERRAVMRAPRVDECRCLATTRDGTHAAVLYAGLDDGLREVWRRPYQAFGPTRRTLAGAHPSGVVFDDGEVWSPITGATVRPGAGDVRLSRTCWLPDRDAFLEVDADVTLVRTRGGLYLRTADGARTLVLPVDRRLVGHWAVEDLAPVPGTSLVLLGERFVIRGPGPVRFTVLDLAARRVVFRSEQDPRHLVGAVHVVAGRDGHLGFAYLDEGAGAWVLHQFDVEPRSLR